MTTLVRLTSQEGLLLKILAAGPRVNQDRTPERFLVSVGFAEVADVGQLKITPAGRAWLEVSWK
jgi:hypothetical protein